MGPDQEELKLKRIACIITVVFHVLNLLFIVHNIFRYVIGLKMKRLLIWTFYILVLIGTLLRIIEFSLYIPKPDRDDNFTYTFDDYAAVATMFVELTLILTIHRLYLALKLLLGEITEN